MMYSPNVRDRRPRPPGAVSRRPAPISHQYTDSSGSMGLGPFDASETPLHKQAFRQPRSPLMSPTDEDEVSIELSADRSVGKKTIGLGLPTVMSSSSPMSEMIKGKGRIAQPTPPPPYGPIPSALPATVSTPPTQDIEDDPLESSWTDSRIDADEDEEHERRRRATDAAKSLGLVIQLSPSATSLDGSGEDMLGEEEIRKRLRQMRSRLKSRDQELLMAAQVAENVLRQHEDLVSALPDHVRALLPQLGHFNAPGSNEYSAPPMLSSDSQRPGMKRASASTPSRSSSTLDAAFTFGDPSIGSSSSARSSTTPGTTKRFFRTVRSGDSSRPFPEHNNHNARHARNVFSTPAHRHSDSYAEIVRQEADDRLIALERALSEARESEEVQRKVAVRLRRDFDKLQREFEYAAKAMEQAEAGGSQTNQATSSAESMTSSQFDTWAWKQRSLDGEVGHGAGEGRVLRPRASRVKLRIKSKTNGENADRRKAETREEEVTEDGLLSNDAGWGMTKFPQFPAAAAAGPSRYKDDDVEDRLTRLPPRPTFSRLKEKLRHASPTKASPARLSGTPERHRSHPSFGTASDSPSDLHQPMSPQRHTSTPRSRFGSIGSHVASVRKYVSESVRSTTIRGRSLGSELGSQYGESEVEDNNDTFVRDTVRLPGNSMARRQKHASDGTEGDMGYGELHPIPSTASSGLSSLALALAPSSTPSHPSSRRSSKQRRSAALPSSSKRSLSPITPTVRRRRSSGRLSGSPANRSRDDPGSFRPKKGRNNWIRPLQLPRAQGLRADSTRLRPGIHPRACSDSQLGLVHRRYLTDVGTTTSQMLKEVASARLSLDSIASSATLLAVDSREELEKALHRDWSDDCPPRLELFSPPARLVNDLIILFSIMLEWIEIMVVIVWRVFVAVKYGRKSIFAAWRKGRDRRYYI